VSDEFITKFNEILTTNIEAQPRNCTLKFKVFDEENVAVLLPAKKIKLNPNNDLLDLLKLHHLDFDLN
jgi:hypothetical protein